MKKKQRSNVVIPGCSRRDFVKSIATAAGVGALASTGVLSGCGDDNPTRTYGTDLRILVSNLYVAEYGTWFDALAQEWGDANGVNVTVDHVTLTEIPTAGQEDINTNQHYDLIEFMAPPGRYENQVMDLTDLNNEVQAQHGSQISLATASSFNPVTNKWYGFCHGFAADPGNFVQPWWTEVGLPNGPTSWEELRTGGAQIKAIDPTHHVGLGLAAAVDSVYGALAMMWSFDASLQNEGGQITLDSAETRECLEYCLSLYTDAMDPIVLGWDTASYNNEALLAGQTSFIINPISSYRAALESTDNPISADDIYFTGSMTGPRGTAKSSHSVIPVFVVPNHSTNPNAAQDFLLHLMSDYAQAVAQSKYYILPAFERTTPNLSSWLNNDEYGSNPRNKLSLLETGSEWCAPLGYPGPTSAAVSQIFDERTLVLMMARVCDPTIAETPDQAIQWAMDRCEPIYEHWSSEGLI